MATSSCSALTRSGTPCRAHPRPGSRYCAFHDRACSLAVAAGRTKGGSVPNRRPSRRRAAAISADLLSRLLLAALAQQEQMDITRLHAIADLAPTLLQALDRSAPPLPSRPPSPAAPTCSRCREQPVDRS
jgi:hypothetical protein